MLENKTVRRPRRKHGNLPALSGMADGIFGNFPQPLQRLTWSNHKRTEHASQPDPSPPSLCGILMTTVSAQSTELNELNPGDKAPSSPS